MVVDDALGDVDQLAAVALRALTEELEGRLLADLMAIHQDALGTLDHGAPPEGALQAVILGEGDCSPWSRRIGCEEVGVIRIEVPDAAQGGALVRSLSSVFDAAGLSLDGDRLEVCIEERGGHDRTLLDALAAVEGWLAESGLSFARVHVGGHSYFVDVPAGVAR